MKKLLAALLCLCLCLGLCACGESSGPEGSYRSADGDAELILRQDGSCTYTERDRSFEGRYTETDSGWWIELELYDGSEPALLEAQADGEDLLVSYNLNTERFIKQ